MSGHVLVHYNHWCRVSK